MANVNYIGGAVDTLRGMYVRSPAWLRRTVAIPLGSLPVSLRYGRRYFDWRSKIVDLRNDREKRTEYVLKERAAVLRMAGTAAYYRDLLAGLWPNGIPSDESLDDDTWRRIPILTKSIIRREGTRLVGAQHGRLSHVSTSGSSGQPLAFLQEETRSIAEFAYVSDAWSRAGFKTGDLRCVFRGILIHDVRKKCMEFEPALGELRCSPFDMSDESMSRYFAEIKKRRIKYLYGYTTAIALFAAFVERTGGTPFNQIKGIFPISEKVLPRHRSLFRDVFPSAMLVPGYGLSEKVAFATEAVGRPDVYEFDPTYGFAELIGDDDMPVRTSGGRGRIVGTGFISKGMPLLRYDSEDEATLVESATPANGYRLVVSDIASKHQAYLVTRQGGVISAASMTPNIDSYDCVSEFQFFQARAGVAELRMVVDPKGTRERAEVFADEMRQYLGKGIRLESVFVDRIPTTTRGKRKMIDQKIPRAEIERALRGLVEA